MNATDRIMREVESLFALDSDFCGAWAEMLRHTIAHAVVDLERARDAAMAEADTTNTNTNTNTAHAAALAMRNAAAALARRRPLYDGASGESADEDLAQAIEDLPLPDVDVTDWKAEAERLRAALERFQQQTQGMLDKFAAALADRRDEVQRLRSVLSFERDRGEKYMVERNAARLEAQREVGETVRKLREERDAALAELERVQARGWPSTPEDVRALLGSSCGAVRYALPVPDGAFEAPPHESDIYTVSAHDLITCNIAASGMRYVSDVALERAQAELAQAREVLRALDHQKAREAPSFRAGRQSAGSRSEPLAGWSSFLWHG